MRIAALPRRAARASLRFYDNRRGGILIFTFLASICLVYTIFLIFNTGLTIDNKIRTQNAVDSAAVTHQVWMARGMNIISSNNVAMTQALAYICIIKALDDTVATAEKVLLGMKVLAAVLVFFPPAAPVVAVLTKLIPIGETCVKVVGAVASSLSPAAKEGGSLWLLMRALSDTSHSVKTGVPIVAKIRGFLVGRRNGADFLLPYPIDPLFGDTAQLPIKEAPFSLLRNPTRYGTKDDSPGKGREGYVNFVSTVFFTGYWWREWGPLPMERGPYLLLSFGLFWMGGPLWVYYLSESYLDALTAGPQQTTVKKPMLTPDDDFIPGLGESRWQYTYEEFWNGRRVKPPPGVDPIPHTDWKTDQPHVKPFSPDSGFRPEPGAQAESWFGTGGGQVTFGWIRENRKTHVDSETGVETKIYIKERWYWVGGEIEEPHELNTEGSDPTLTFFIMDDSAEAQKRYYVIFGGYYMPERLIAQSSFTRGRGMNRVWAYGQAKLYNPTCPDMFTQDWRARLSPATLVEELVDALMLKGFPFVTRLVRAINLH